MAFKSKKNTKQDTLMMTFMIANPELARGDLTEGRDVNLKKWMKLNNQLNLIGPPVKTLPTWKKTWQNRLRSLRTILAKDPAGTGLSPSEKEVAAICSLYNSKPPVTRRSSAKKAPNARVKQEPRNDDEDSTDEEKENQIEKKVFPGLSSALLSQQASTSSNSGAMPEMLKTLQAMTAQQAQHFRNMEAMELKKLQVTEAISENIIKFLNKEGRVVRET